MEIETPEFALQNPLAHKAAVKRTDSSHPSAAWSTTM